MVGHDSFNLGKNIEHLPAGQFDPNRHCLPSLERRIQRADKHTTTLCIRRNVLIPLASLIEPNAQRHGMAGVGPVGQHRGLTCGGTGLAAHEARSMDLASLAVNATEIRN